MLIFKALHILSMVTMVTIFSGGEFFYAVAFWRRDVRALAWLHRIEKETRAPFVGIGALLLGIIFGLLTAATGGIDFFKGWLIAAYVLVAVFLVNANLTGQRLISLADRAVEADEGKRPKEEVVAEMSNGIGRLFTFFFIGNAAIFAAIILDMVLKPF
jgi:uncharacterized membrane protein